MTNYLLEMIVILLLGTTVIFCWRLYNKITEIKSTRNDMAGLIQVFDEAIVNTNNGLSALKDASANAANDLKKYTIKSQELVSELAFMNDTAVRLADRLESLILESKDIENRCHHLLEKAAVVKLPRAKSKAKVSTKKNASVRSSEATVSTKKRKTTKITDFAHEAKTAEVKNKTKGKR